MSGYALCSIPSTLPDMRCIRPEGHGQPCVLVGAFSEIDARVLQKELESKYACGRRVCGGDCGWADKSRSEETVNHPSHYGGDTTYEVIKVLEAWGITDPYVWQTIKYLARAGKKATSPELEDLKKGQFYLNRKIANLEKEAK